MTKLNIDRLTDLPTEWPSIDLQARSLTDWLTDWIIVVLTVWIVTSRMTFCNILALSFKSVKQPISDRVSLTRPVWTWRDAQNAQTERFRSHQLPTAALCSDQVTAHHTYISFVKLDQQASAADFNSISLKWITTPQLTYICFILDWFVGEFLQRIDVSTTAATFLPSVWKSEVKMS